MPPALLLYKIWTVVCNYLLVGKHSYFIIDPLEILVNYVHINVYPRNSKQALNMIDLMSYDTKYSNEYNKNTLHHQIMKQCDHIDNMLNETLNKS